MIITGISRFGPHFSVRRPRTEDACVAASSSTPFDEQNFSSKNNARALNRTLFQAHKNIMIRFLEREDYYNPFQCAAAVAVFFLHPKSTSAMFILVGKKAFSTARGWKRHALETAGQKGVNPAFRRPSKAIINLNEMLLSAALRAFSQRN
jgi:hypothetical protein